jgi:hypothetical protein
VESSGRWRGILPAALLLAIALVQIALARAAALTPWAGGGFGMFASTDARGSRHLHVFALHAGVRRELIVPEAARERAWRALSFPSERALERLGAQLGAGRDPVWGRPDAIELQVWATRFERGTLAPSAYLLRALEVAIEPG